VWPDLKRHHLLCIKFCYGKKLSVGYVNKSQLKTLKGEEMGIKQILTAFICKNDL